MFADKICSTPAQSCQNLLSSAADEARKFLALLSFPHPFVSVSRVRTTMCKSRCWYKYFSQCFNSFRVLKDDAALVNKTFLTHILSPSWLSRSMTIKAWRSRLSSHQGPRRVFSLNWLINAAVLSEMSTQKAKTSNKLYHSAPHSWCWEMFWWNAQPKALHLIFFSCLAGEEEKALARKVLCSHWSSSSCWTASAYKTKPGGREKYFWSHASCTGKVRLSGIMTKLWICQRPFGGFPPL